MQEDNHTSCDKSEKNEDSGIIYCFKKLVAMHNHVQIAKLVTYSMT